MRNVSDMLPGLESGVPEVMASFAHLGRRGEEDLLNLLVCTEDDHSARIAARALGEYASERVIEELQRILDYEDPRLPEWVGPLAIEALGQLRSRIACPRSA